MVDVGRRCTGSSRGDRGAHNAGGDAAGALVVGQESYGVLQFVGSDVVEACYCSCMSVPVADTHRVCS